MFVKLMEHDMGIIKWLSHKAYGVFNSPLPRRQKPHFTQTLQGQKINVRTSFLWKSLNLPPFPSCLISTLLRHVNLYSQQGDLAENEPSAAKTYC